jgi:hypothetical protein
VRNLSGQYFKISLPDLIDQSDREAFTAENSLTRFRVIIDFTVLNSVILESDSVSIGNQIRYVLESSG